MTCPGGSPRRRRLPRGDSIDPDKTVDDVLDDRTTPLTDEAGESTPKPIRPRGVRPVPIVPGYEVIEVIGRGGMGVVYKARQIRLDRLVALKMVLAGAHASPDQLARFSVESQAVAQLQHPGIIQIHEVGEHDGLPYFSLEYVAGGSLAKKLGGKPQPPREAAVMVRDPRHRHRGGAPTQHHPPRPEAGQCAPDAGRPAQDHRLRPGEAIGRRLAPYPYRRHHGDAELHGPRASLGPDPPDWPAHRPVRLGRDPLRDARRPAAVPGRLGPGDARAGPDPGTGAPDPASAEDPR